MKKLDRFFPLNAAVIPGDVKSVILTVVIYLVACAVLRVLGWILEWIALIGWIVGILLSLAGLYCVAGIILAFIRYFQKA